MRNKIICGLLALVLLLFFVTSSWALDYKSYLKSKYYGDPWEESNRVIVSPQIIDVSPSTIEFILIPTGQNLPVFIHVKTPPEQVTIKTEALRKNSNSSLDKIDNLK